MEFSTVSRKNPNRIVPMWYNPCEAFDISGCVSDRFRLVFVEEGTGIIKLNDKRATFMAPAMFCVNERETIMMEQKINLKAKTLYFHPEVVNGLLNFENIREGIRELPLTCMQDSYWLQPFTLRNDKYKGYFSPWPLTARKMSRIFDAISRELDEQRDGFWPCRSRSLFLELLFLMERIFLISDASSLVTLPDKKDTTDEVILYMHTNYQKKITLAELCRRFHINRTTLEEHFIKSTGLSVLSYLIQLRVKLASLMLRDTELPVLEIMERSGFYDNTHFGRIFRKYTGFSPTEYRRQFCWMSE